ncbi:MAG: hypothetical protein ACFCD0_21590 [Gemmataceae bacterium]
MRTRTLAQTLWACFASGKFPGTPRFPGTRTLLTLALFLGVVGQLLFVPTEARAQVEVPPTPFPFPNYPLPLGGPRYEEGGIFVGFSGLFLQQTNPMENQVIGRRGFIDFDGSIGGVPGRPVGSGEVALQTDDVSGPVTFQPGMELVVGWRFRDGIVIEGVWWHLTDARYSATAGIIPQGFGFGPGLSDTFITAPVVNFPIEYAGQGTNLGVGNVGATFGIWNAATEMNIDFVQRFDMGAINVRIPIEETDTRRFYGLAGIRALIMWERFTWRTTSRDVTGFTTPADQAIYTNVVSNRLYGGTIGCGYDWFLGSSRFGGFALTVDLQGSVMFDIVKERAKYQLADPFLATAASRAQNEFNFSPVVQGGLHFWWYPTQGIQVRLGYDVLAAFNTVAATEPVDFNYGALSPPYEDWQTRVFHGFRAGVAFVF